MIIFYFINLHGNIIYLKEYLEKSNWWKRESNQINYVLKTNKIIQIYKNEKDLRYRKEERGKRKEETIQYIII